MKNIAVIGAGISGLSTAFVLINQGYRITVLAKAFSPNTTSNIATAFGFLIMFEVMKELLFGLKKVIKFTNN